MQCTFKSHPQNQVCGMQYLVNLMVRSVFVADKLDAMWTVSAGLVSALTQYVSIQPNPTTVHTLATLTHHTYCTLG